MVAERSPAPAGAALYIALVQFFFVTTWTVYVIYLPKLLDAAGLPPAWTPWILLADQLVFLLADIVCGVFADRVQRSLGRIGPWIVGATVLSCAAFVLLPHLPLFGAAAPLVGLVLIAVWTTTSSALRAPPWVLLGKYAARPALPWLNALTLLGLAAGGAAAPFLAVALKNIDPRLPFVLSSLALLLTTAGIVHLERRLARRPVAVAPASASPRLLNARHGAWMLAILLLAAAFQTHFSLNAAAAFLRFAAADQLEWLMPLFWVGYAVGALGGGPLCKRFPALNVMSAAALIAAGTAFSAAHAVSLTSLIVAQLIAGAAWGGMQVAMFSSAAELGRTGREGLALGTMFGMLALAALARIGVVLAGVPKMPDLASMLGWLPPLLWGAGALLLAWLALRASAPQPEALRT
jgi:MFS family permease